MVNPTVSFDDVFVLQIVIKTYCIITEFDTLIIIDSIVGLFKGLILAGLCKQSLRLTAAASYLIIISQIGVYHIFIDHIYAYTMQYETQG